MSQTDRDYSENLKFIDQITNKVFRKDYNTHRKTISQPDSLEIARQPDRLELSMNSTIILQLYPSIFKYVKIRVKDCLKPLYFHYESAISQSQIKIFLSKTNDSPNILSHHLQIQNKPRFQFTEQPTQITKFQCDFIYLSIYSDKYTELKFKVFSGATALPLVMHKPTQKNQFLKEPGSYSRRSNRSGKINLNSEHKPRSQNSFIKLNKESQMKFRILLEERQGSIKKINTQKIEEILQKKKQIFFSKHINLIEQSYQNEILRLTQRVNRLHDEIQIHTNTIDIEWFGILYLALLAKIIRHKYFKRVMRIVVTNKVQVCCRKFMRIMKTTLSTSKGKSYKRALHENCNILFDMVAKGLKKSVKQKAKLILKDFIFIYSYQSDGMKKLQQFQKKIQYIQQKWRSYKKSEKTYIQKSTFIIQTKWYVVYKQLQSELSLQRQAPPIDKVLVAEVIKRYLDHYKKNFIQTTKLMQSLKVASQLTLFRPLTLTVMKEIMELYLKEKQQIKK